MKALLWLVFGVLLAAWTGLVVLTEHLSQWLLASMANAQTHELVQRLGQWPVPAWLGFWVDTTWLKGLQDFATSLLQWGLQVMPSLDAWMAWITPLLWGVWGLGTLLLILGAFAGHWWVKQGLAFKPPLARR
jgi:hypothetical protein